jgi:hypothetical protein
LVTVKLVLLRAVAATAVEVAMVADAMFCALARVTLAWTAASFAALATLEASTPCAPVGTVIVHPVPAARVAVAVAAVRISFAFAVPLPLRVGVNEVVPQLVDTVGVMPLRVPKAYVGSRRVMASLASMSTAEVNSNSTAVGAPARGLATVKAVPLSVATGTAVEVRMDADAMFVALASVTAASRVASFVVVPAFPVVTP